LKTGFSAEFREFIADFPVLPTKNPDENREEHRESAPHFGQENRLDCSCRRRHDGTSRETGHISLRVTCPQLRFSKDPNHVAYAINTGRAADC
jgi:hypothetical protein